MQLEALQSLALSVAAARSPDAVLKEMVHGLGRTEGVALARVWLLMQKEGEESYLALRASVGASIVDPSERWTRIDGAHQHIALSYGKVGQIAGTSRPLLLQRGPRDWVVKPEWAEAEGIESFAGQPLVFKEQVLGVVALFSRTRLEVGDLHWLRVFADHAAVAIANARAFEEIAQLRERAERERDYLREPVRSALQQGDIIAESPAMKQVMAQLQGQGDSRARVSRDRARQHRQSTGPLRLANRRPRWRGQAARHQAEHTRLSHQAARHRTAAMSAGRNSLRLRHEILWRSSCRVFRDCERHPNSGQNRQ